MFKKRLLFPLGLRISLSIVFCLFLFEQNGHAQVQKIEGGKETVSQSHHPIKINLHNNTARDETVLKLKQQANIARENAHALARIKGWKTKGKKADGGLFELVSIREDGRPLYLETQNDNAAISTAVDQIRDHAPFNLSGISIDVGVWDGGSVMPNHVEFEQRVTVYDGSTPHHHATHVGGTIGSAGLDTATLGMAPDCKIHSYDWGNDIAEMTSMAATSPAQNNRLYISNHSYGPTAGWAWWGDDSGQPGLHWHGPWGEGVTEDDVFGSYGDGSFLLDDLVFAAEYYLPIRAAGNDRNDSAPAPGDLFYYYSDGDWHEKEYEPLTDPPGEDSVKGGYDTIPQGPTAKNVLTVGAVTDAVDNGIRRINNALMSSFSGWGPTDDGRIKPDVVANGVGLWSTYFDEDNPEVINDYARSDGTSMAAPNVTGTIALILEYYDTLFPAQEVRAATLKGLLIHTADNLGQTGPDYQTGWGLVNGREAVEFIRLLQAEPHRTRLIEAVKTEETQTFTFSCDGDWPARVTLSWSDPAGSVLINDLDLRLIEPDGTIHYPYTLDPQNPVDPAVTGDNFRDPLEQVYVPVQFPASAGEWTIHISHKGTLQNGSQPFSLLIDAWPPPAENDDLDRAIELTGKTGQVVGANIVATIEDGEPNHAGVSVGKSVWYKWTAPFNGPVTIDTYGSWFNTTLGVYRKIFLNPTPTTLIEQAANDDFSPDGQHSEVTVNAEAGATYYIAVDGTGTASHGKIVLNYMAVPSPDNDDFTERERIYSDSTSTTIGATVEPGEPDHAGTDSGQSVWWTFTLDHPGQIIIDTRDSDFDTALAVYTGETLAGLIEIAANDNAPLTWTSEVAFYAQAGVDYHIAVCGGQAGGTYQNDFTGKVKLNIRPINDDLKNRTVISGLQGQYNGLQNGATIEDHLSFGSGWRPEGTIWWSFTPPASGTMFFSIETNVAGYYWLGFFINTGTFAEPELKYIRSSQVDGESSVSGSIYADIGTEIILVLGKKNGTYYLPDQHINLIWQPKAGSNDDVYYSSTSSSNYYSKQFSINTEATAEPEEPAHGGFQANRSLWYKWAKKSGELEVTLDTFDSETDTVLAVYRLPSVLLTPGDFSEFIPVKTNDNYGIPQSKVTFCTNEPGTYYIAVDSRDQGGITRLNAITETTQSQLTLYKTGAGSVLVNGVPRDPLWADWLDTCSELSLEPVPSPHYHFVEWQGDINSTAVPLDLVLDKSTGIRAVFAEDPQYTLSLSGTASGQVMVDGQIQNLPWSGNFYVDETAVIRAIPAEGYGFDSWSGSIDESSAVTTVIINDNLNITANFSPRSADKITVVQGNYDTTLYEDPKGLIGNSQGQFFFVGSHGGAVRNGLLSFDLDGVVPIGATITSASLYLHHSAADAIEEDDIFFLRAAKSWGEGNSDAPGDETVGMQAASGDATWWHNNYPSQLWDTPGGDIDQPVGIRGVARIGGPNDYLIEINSSINPGMLEDLQYWSNSPQTNNGWLMAAESAQATPAKRFHSSENPDTNSRPRLEITYYTGSVVPPQVTINTLRTANSSPELNGTVNDVNATVLVGFQIGILWETIPAMNNGDGTWTLAAGALPNLQPGLWSFGISATDANGNTSSDTTNNEVEIVPPDYVQETCVSNARELQMALTVAQGNELADHIKLEQGVYSVVENQGLTGPLPFTYYSEKEYSLYISGGYSSNCSEQDRNALLTRLDGEQENRTLAITSRGTGAAVDVNWLTIENGSAHSGGGATILTTGGLNSLSHCIVRKNVSSDQAGGVLLYSENSTINLSNCLLAENQSAGDGGGAVLQAGDGVTCTGNTIVYNSIINGTSRDTGGGLFINLTGSNGGLNIFNTIFWNNSTINGTEAAGASIAVANVNNLPIMFMHNDLLLHTIEGFTDSSGENLEYDPSFSDEQLSDYHLTLDSPLINKGTDQAAQLEQYDLEGLPRVARDCSDIFQVDMGAYESVHGIHGDIDCNGTVDLADIILLLQTMTGSDTSTMSLVLDIADDGKLGLAEVIAILQRLTKM